MSEIQPRIDFHSHGLPPDFPVFGGRYGDGWVELSATGPCTADITIGGQPYRAIDDRCWHPERRLADMDAEGVDLQVISPIPITFSYHLDPRGVAELCRAQNNWLAEVGAEHPDRFAGLGAVPLQDPALAVSVAVEAVRELGLAGIEIGTNVDGRSLDDPMFDEVWAACAEVDAVVFVHPWAVLGGHRFARHGLAASIGLPTETTQAAASLVLGGVLDRHPDLQFVLAHGGGSFLALLPRIEQCWNLLAGGEGLCEQPPSSYARRFHYDSLVFDPRSVQTLVGAVGADRIVVGTDYPFAIAERPAGAAVDTAELSDSELRAIRSDNATRLLSATKPKTTNDDQGERP